MKALLVVVVIQPTYDISSFDFVSGSSTQLVSVGGDGMLGQGDVSTAPSGAAVSDSTTQLISSNFLSRVRSSASEAARIVSNYATPFSIF